MTGQSTQLLLLIAMFAAFFVLVLRPQQKRAAEHKAMVSSISVGDEVVTAGGIFATVVATGDRLRLRTVDGSEFELAPQAVGSRITSGANGGAPEDAGEE